jgi:hypothetical protein
MKVKLKNVLGLAALGMTLVATTVPTWAGSVSTTEVTISSNGTGPFASGSLVGVRYSADSTQFIGCHLHAHPSGSPQIICHALDSAGNYLSCISSDARHVASAQRITDSSSLFFNVKPGSSACEIINIYNFSSGLK